MRPQRRNREDRGGEAGRRGNRVFVADVAVQRARLGKANVMRFVGVRPQTTHGCVATNLQCSLSRRRMVLPATRRQRAPSLAGGKIGATAAFPIDERKGSEPANRILLRRLRLSVGSRGRHFVRRELFAEGGLNEVSVGNRERVLGREVLMNPIRGTRLPIEVGRGRQAVFRAAPPSALGRAWSAHGEPAGVLGHGRASPASLSAARSRAALAVRRRRRLWSGDRASRSSSPPISQRLCRGSLSKGTCSARAAVARAASSVASGAPSRRASSRYAAS
jgi:hypothetical protein